LNYYPVFEHEPKIDYSKIICKMEPIEANKTKVSIIIIIIYNSTYASQNIQATNSFAASHKAQTRRSERPLSQQRLKYS
jgi:hypothetical protein